MVKQKLSEDKNEVSFDILKSMYYQRKGLLIKDTDVMQDDITDEYYHYVKDKIRNNEVVNIAIIGEVATGKSTSAIAEMDRANKYIEKLKNKKIDRSKYILSDQTEFIRFINTQEEDLCIVIDEYNRMSQTGLNSSTEGVLYDYYSEVFAQKHLHRFSCAPSFVLDKNATVILEFIGKDQDKKISKFKLSYRNVADGYMPLCLGTIIIDVSNVLETDFYKKYRKRKFTRMELLDKHGVRDIRELEFASITLKAVKHLKDITKDGKKTNISDMILATISRICREEKRIYSMIVTGEIASRVRNILGLYADLYQASIRLAKSKNDTERLMIEDKQEKIKEILNVELKEEEKKLLIYNDFLNI